MQPQPDPWHGRTLPGLDLRGQIIEGPVDLSHARIEGKVDLTGATLRGGLNATHARFEGPFLATRCEIEGDVLISWAEFRHPVEMSWTRIRGRLYAWRARFAAEARFRQLMVEPGPVPGKSYVHPGELNFSWTWFHGPTDFERCHWEGPVYFWRTRFFERCRFDETSFAQDATFMGKPSEVCLSRRELGWPLFDRLQNSGLLLPDDEECALIEGREVRMFGQLSNVNSSQQLQERMEAHGLTTEDRARLAHEYQVHSGPMFAQEASLQRLRIGMPRQVKFICVNASNWDLSGTNPDAIAFFNAEQQPVSTAVGLGRFYDRAFISYGGPDVAIASQLNRALLNSGVETFFYPEHALPGRLINEEMRLGVGDYDRVLLVCSSRSPGRPGWVFELQEALHRERRDGEGRVLLVLAVDDGLWTPWPSELEGARQALLLRNVADFRGCLEDPQRFNAGLHRVLHALQRTEPH